MDYRVSLEPSQLYALPDQGENPLMDYFELLLGPSIGIAPTKEQAVVIFQHFTSGQKALYQLADLFSTSVYPVNRFVSYVWHDHPFNEETIQSLMLLNEFELISQYSKAMHQFCATPLWKLCWIRVKKRWHPWLESLPLGLDWMDTYLEKYALTVQQKMIAYVRSHPEEFIR